MEEGGGPMADNTSIQWCDSTSNPLMGCDGCPLYPTVTGLRLAVGAALVEKGIPAEDAMRLAEAHVDPVFPSTTYHGRRQIAEAICGDAGLGRIRDRADLVRAIATPFRCYAGTLHLRHGKNPFDPEKRTNAGYAPTFEQVTAFPGRMERMARSRDLSGTRRPNKPWLDGLPRLVFVSDMGDALCGSVDFGYLKSEIIDAVMSPKGRRHIWLWLTKRPARMAEFARWLREEHGIDWPDNLVAMTSVIDRRMLRAVDHLREVPAKVRGISVEPLIERVEIDIAGIDWLIVGGESGPGARPFDLAWARELRERCREEGVAFFCKQLGAAPVENGERLTLEDPHGGEWNEWPRDLRVREMPAFLGETASMLRAA